jgi:hypothetical protein
VHGYDDKECELMQYTGLKVLTLSSWIAALVVFLGK